MLALVERRAPLLLVQGPAGQERAVLHRGPASARPRAGAGRPRGVASRVHGRLTLRQPKDAIVDLLTSLPSSARPTARSWCPARESVARERDGDRSAGAQRRSADAPIADRPRRPAPSWTVRLAQSERSGCSNASSRWTFTSPASDTAIPSIGSWRITTAWVTPANGLLLRPRSQSARARHPDRRPSMPRAGDAHEQLWCRRPVITHATSAVRPSSSLTVAWTLPSACASSRSRTSQLSQRCEPSGDRPTS